MYEAKAKVLEALVIWSGYDPIEDLRVWTGDFFKFPIAFDVNDLSIAQILTSGVQEPILFAFDLARGEPGPSTLLIDLYPDSEGEITVSATGKATSAIEYIKNSVSGGKYYLLPPQR